MVARDVLARAVLDLGARGVLIHDGAPGYFVVAWPTHGISPRLISDLLSGVGGEVLDYWYEAERVWVFYGPASMARASLPAP